jgi:hypothetical protein
MISNNFNNNNKFYKFINYLNYLFIFLLLFLIIKVGYKLYITDDTYTKIQYIIYFKIFFFLIFIKFLFIFFNYKLKKLYLAYLGWIVIFLFTYEVYLNFDYNYKTKSYDPNITVNKHFDHKIKSYKKNNGKDFDLRTYPEFYNDLKKKENNVSIILPFVETSKIKEGNIFPLSFKSLSYVIDCNENGYYSVNFSDRYGFNNPDDVWNLPEVDYLILGDSMTYGSCVNRPDDIASVLRKISKNNIINLSIGGSGPLLQLAILKEYFPKNVKNILYFFYEGNDIYNMLQEHKNLNLNKYLKKNYNQNLIYKVNELDELIDNIVDEKNSNYLKKKKEKKIDDQKVKNNIISEYHIKDILKLYRLREKFLLPYVQSVLLKDILNQIHSIAEVNGANLYFIFLPDASTDIDEKISSFWKKKFKNFSKGKNIKFVDIFEEVWRQQKNYLVLFPFNTIGSGHYSANGYKIVAHKLYEILINN